MERTKLIDAPVKRVALLADAGVKPVAVPVQGELELGADLPKLSDWFTCVPWENGEYDLKGGGPFGNKSYIERCLFKRHKDTPLVGLWFARDRTHGDWVSLGWHADIMELGHSWRGLAQPPEEKIARTPLLDALAANFQSKPGWRRRNRSGG